jgi:hypothetical protein
MLTSVKTSLYLLEYSDYERKKAKGKAHFPGKINRTTL